MAYPPSVGAREYVCLEFIERCTASPPGAAASDAIREGTIPVPIVSPQDVPVQQMPGRTLQWLATAETIGAQKLSMCRMECPPGATVRPVHAHRDTEELVYILAGEGEAWVEGEVAAFAAGDVVLFPANARHVVRNTGPGTLVAACFFAPATRPASYVLCDDVDPWPGA